MAMEMPEANGGRYEAPEVRLLGTLPELTQGPPPASNADYIFGTDIPIGHTSLS